ncbi:MAG: hypothetical protein ORO03_02520 [Alphaproteobacteria bacterium]|nr:hypothetical protein [Alphaproteobacteria bacterium]
MAELRFEFIEKSLADRGKTLSDSKLAELESLWQLAKLQERSDV